VGPRAGLDAVVKRKIPSTSPTPRILRHMVRKEGREGDYRKDLLPYRSCHLI